MLDIIEVLRDLRQRRVLLPELRAATAAIKGATIIVGEESLPQSVPEVYGQGGSVPFRLTGHTMVVDSRSAVLLWEAMPRPKEKSGVFGFLDIQPGVPAGLIAYSPEVATEIAALSRTIFLTWGIVSQIEYQMPDRSLQFTASLALAGRYQIDFTSGTLLYARRNAALLNEMVPGLAAAGWAPAADEAPFTEEEHSEVVANAVYAIQQCAFYQSGGR